MKSFVTTTAVAAFVFAAGGALAKEVTVPQEVVDQIRGWASAPEVVAAVKAQNDENAKLTEDDIVKLDKAWRAETKSGDKPLISRVLGSAMSEYLRGVKANAGGRYTEIFVMDNKGLNVGQSDVTSDYWQGDEGDEDKWRKSYGAGPDGVFIDKVEFDESSQTYQSQVSIAIADPESKQVIGAVTVGINVDE